MLHDVGNNRDCDVDADHRNNTTLHVLVLGFHMSDYVFYLLCDIKRIVIAVSIDLSTVCIGLPTLCSHWHQASRTLDLVFNRMKLSWRWRRLLVPLVHRDDGSQRHCHVLLDVTCRHDIDIAGPRTLPP